MGWATLPEGGDRGWAAHRLSVVRGFAKHLALFDKRTEVPPADLLPARSHRATLYLYSEDEVRRLMAAAKTLRSPLRQATFSTLLGLLWVTGSIGETLRLDREDVDLTHGILTVRESKFGKSREIPVHESTAGAIHAYTKATARALPAGELASIFRFGCGNPPPLRQLPCRLSHIGAQGWNQETLSALPSTAA